MGQRALHLTVVVVALIGVLDASIGANWDLVVVFAIVAVLAAYGAARSTSRRPTVPIRSDLVAWMGARATSGGERVEDVADRAVALYRAGITGDDAGL